jgi:tRNA G18 (ribose-2'-O)-methylase SpoU
MVKLKSLILHDIRSAYNVGSILRTADGFGINQVYMSGLTPYPIQISDTRLPHIAKNTHNRIAKTALGAELTVKTIAANDIYELINELKTHNLAIIALEQHPNSLKLNDAQLEKDSVLVFGNELSGLDNQILNLADKIIEIPMSGHKKSFNVSVAGAIAIYHFLNQA